MTSVLTSVESNNVRALQLLLAVPGTVPTQDVRRALVYACLEGRVECLQCLLDANGDPEIKDSSGNTLLHLAAKAGRSEVVAALLGVGCSSGWRGCGGSTALHLSVRHGHDQCSELLLLHGANVNAADSVGDTPLITAIKNSQYGAVKMLLNWGCEVNKVDKDGCSALHYACRKAQSVGSLVGAGADPNLTDKDSNSPAMLAAAEGFSGVISVLLKHGYHVNLQNKFTGKTILHIVAGKGHVDCVKELVLAGADINIIDKAFRTPLWYAIHSGRFSVVKYLFRANSNVDKFQCPVGVPLESCPVNLALAKQHLKVFKLFLLTGYDSHHVRLCLSQDNVKKQLAGHGDLSLWMAHTQGPLALKQLCRMWIRHHQGRLLFHDIANLPLPIPLKEFLSLKELDDENLFIP